MSLTLTKSTLKLQHKWVHALHLIFFCFFKHAYFVTVYFFIYWQSSFDDISYCIVRNACLRSVSHTHTREQLWTWGTGGVSRHLLHTLTARSLAFTQDVSADSSQSPFPSVGHLYIVPHRLAMAQENRSTWATACRPSRYTSPRYSTRQNCKDRLTTTTPQSLTWRTAPRAHVHFE